MFGAYTWLFSRFYVIEVIYSGLHNPNSAVRSRMFYLFHRFVRENKTDIPVDLALTLIEGIRDLLLIQVEMPEPESEDQ